MFARYKTSISTIATIFAALLCFSDVVALDLRPTTSPFTDDGTSIFFRVSPRNMCVGAGTPLDALSLCTAPVADATRGLLNLSNTALSAGSASGTFISGNPAACAGDFLNLQVGNAARAKLTCAGALTVVSSTNNLSIFAATTSAQLAGVLNDETGTGLAVFSIAPVFTSINNNLSIFAATTSAQLSGVLSDETGTGLAVFSIAPVFTSINNNLSIFASTTSAQLGTLLSDEVGSGKVAFDTNVILATPKFDFTSGDNKAVATFGTTGVTGGYLGYRGGTDSIWIGNPASGAGNKFSVRFADDGVGGGTDTVSFDGDGGLRIATGTKPACASGIRGKVYYVAGAAGVLDTFELCRKDAADAYAWVSLF